SSGDIKSCHALNADRLQGDGVFVAANENVGTDAKASGNRSGCANVIASKRTGAQIIGRRYHAPNHNATFLIADIDAERLDRAVIVLLCLIVTWIIYAFDVARRTEDETQIAGDIAFKKAGCDATSCYAGARTNRR